MRYSNLSVDEMRRYLKMLESGEVTAASLCIHMSCYLDRYMGLILKEHAAAKKEGTDGVQVS